MGEKVGKKVGEKVGEKTGEKVGEIHKLNLCPFSTLLHRKTKIIKPLAELPNSYIADISGILLQIHVLLHNFNSSSALMNGPSSKNKSMVVGVSKKKIRKIAY